MYVYCVTYSDTGLFWLPELVISNYSALEDGLLKVNNDHIGFYRVNHEDHMWTTISHQLETNHRVTLLCAHIHTQKLLLITHYGQQYKNNCCYCHQFNCVFLLQQEFDAADRTSFINDVFAFARYVWWTAVFKLIHRYNITSSLSVIPLAFL